MVWGIVEWLQLNPDKWILAVGVLVLTFVVFVVLRTLMKRYITNSSKKLLIDATRYNFLKHTLTALVFLIGVGLAIYMIPPLRTLSVSLFAGAGILAVVIGLASQQALSNIISGVMIVIFKPFRIGDWISIGADTKGIVEDITLRHTVIRNRENKRVIVPNSVISNESIENAHIGEEAVCRFVEIGISYDADIDRAMKIMREEAMKHPEFLDYRKPKDKREGKEPVRVEVMGFGDSSINLRAWVWAATPERGYGMHLQLNKAIKERFDREGVEIPFPYRTVVYKKDLERGVRRR